ncbi:DivIVA domain-containing protein [Plectonema cf. radiosum LEGE 06105]|uniref:DivIVA domain-containing protein n=1 Tax=Plectonema cf. radiosum LEGE 06105 TaxID=945769 RepID=A0A8J7FGF7_9CYAN|nr:DivIVA domain-containing protein [Plectonema radiosum]MBE9217059.1 DivIVA domain-containing protein [Plectonema cf. radiosum LEGE 06105]
MLHPQPNGIEPNQNGSSPPSQQFPQQSGSVDIQQELNRLEEIILSSFRIPLTRKTLVDEEKLLEQLDFIRLSLPEAFQEAILIIQQREEIFLEAEAYGQQMVEAAQAKRAQVLNESDIIRQAELETEQLKRQVQQECEQMMQETLDEIERKRRICQQEIEEMRRQAIEEAEQIAQGADQYADNVLENIELELTESLKIIRNGRQQLYPESQPPQRGYPGKSVKKK